MGLRKKLSAKKVISLDPITMPYSAYNRYSRTRSLVGKFDEHKSKA